MSKGTRRHVEHSIHGSAPGTVHVHVRKTHTLMTAHIWTAPIRSPYFHEYIKLQYYYNKQK